MSVVIDIIDITLLVILTTEMLSVINTETEGNARHKSYDLLHTFSQIKFTRGRVSLDQILLAILVPR